MATCAPVWPSLAAFRSNWFAVSRSPLSSALLLRRTEPLVSNALVLNSFKKPEYLRRAQVPIPPNRQASLLRRSPLPATTYPSGRVVTTVYDGANRPSTVTGVLSGARTGYASGVTYAPHGGSERSRRLYE